MVLNASPKKKYDRPPGANEPMSILERSALPPAPAADHSTLPPAPAADRSALPPAPTADRNPPSDPLHVITAGGVDNMEAILGARGFDVVAVAQTEEALIDAVSANEPDAIIVEADLCASLEHVRDLAPDAVLIVIGDHTPAGALGRIERGVSGTTMAGLLHALVVEGIGGAVVWGFLPAFRSRGALQVSQRISGWLLTAKADLVREYVASTFRDHAELLTAASTVAVTVSASLVLTLSSARTHERQHERPERVQVPAPAEGAPQYSVAALSPTTPIPAYGPSWNEGEPGGRWGPNRGESRADGRHVGEDANDLGQIENPVADDLGQIENPVADNLGQSENPVADDLGQIENASGNHGENAGGDHGRGESDGGDHGQGEDAGGDHGQGEDAGGDHGKGEDAGGDHGKGDGDGDNLDGDDQDGGDEDGDNLDGDDQDGGDQDGSDNQDGDDQAGDDQDDTAPLAAAVAETSALGPATRVALTH